jgi:WD40 repeat protein
VRLWDVGDPDSAKWHVQRELTHDGAVWSIAFSPHGRLLASGGVNREVILWDVATGKPVKRFGEKEKGGDIIYSLAFSLDGQLLAAGDGSRRIRVWDVKGPDHKKWRMISEKKELGADIFGLAFHPKTRLLTAGVSNEIHQWDVWKQKGPELPPMKHHTGTVFNL